MQVSGCNDDHEDETEIFIGLVPISTLVQQYVHPLQSDLPNAPIPQALPNPPIQNTTASPNNASFANSDYPKAIGYPNTNSPNLTHNIPMAPIRISNIGFMVPLSPPGTNAPYSMTPATAQSSYMPYHNFALPSAPPPN